MNNNDFYIRNNALQPDNSDKGKKKFLPVLILVLLIGVAGFLVYELKFKKDDPKKSDEYVEYDPNYKLEDGENKNEQGNNDGMDDLIDVENPESDDNSKSNSTPGNILSNIVSNANKNSNSNNTQTSNGKVPSVTKTIPVTGVKLSATSITLSKNEKTTLSPTITPSNATNKGVVWTSSNSSIVSVDQNGNVTAKDYGTATITVTTNDGKKTATVKIDVSRPPVNSIVMTLTSTKTYVGETISAGVTYYPYYAADRRVTWKSSNTKVATINSSGTIKAVGRGTTTITATTLNGKTASKTLTVMENPAHYSIKFTKANYGNSSTYALAVYKNNSSFEGYSKVLYKGSNGKTVNVYNGAPTSTTIITENTKTATLVLSDGTEVYGVSVTYVK